MRYSDMAPVPCPPGGRCLKDRQGRRPCSIRLFRCTQYLHGGLIFAAVCADGPPPNSRPDGNVAACLGFFVPVVYDMSLTHWKCTGTDRGLLSPG
jgi:hypothetical protein